MDFILVGSSLAYTCYSKVEVNGSGKHSSLLPYGNYYGRKMFYRSKLFLSNLSKFQISYGVCPGRHL
jgi:hypothetical protein